MIGHVEQSQAFVDGVISIEIHLIHKDKDRSVSSSKSMYVYETLIEFICIGRAIKKEFRTAFILCERNVFLSLLAVCSAD